MDLSELRQEYKLKKLSRKGLLDNPLLQFKRWFEESLECQLLEPNAFALATLNEKNEPSCRMVLMKKFDERGILFFTNLESRKSKELLKFPKSSGLFWWKELERQVRFEGLSSRASDAEAAEYFKRRPHQSQLGAWASKQSEIISSRTRLEDQFKKMEKTFRGKEIPLPPFWGGFWIKPVRWEFWQGREDRLHDRFRYSKEDGIWKIERLSP